MEDSKDTIIIENIPKTVEGKVFIELVRQAGPIKIENDHGHQLAELRVHHTDKNTKEGIVTYEDSDDVKNAFKIIKEKKYEWKEVKVTTAENYFTKKAETSDNNQTSRNSAWVKWSQMFSNMPIGGKGGKGGKGIFSFLKGKDGQPGESCHGGRGGEGGEGGRIFSN